MASSRNYVKGRESLNDGIAVNMLWLRLVKGKVVLSLRSGGGDMGNADIKHLGSLICFFTHFVFKLSEVICNQWLSPDDVCSHMWCNCETCIYVFYKEYISPYHVTRV